jgi:radical SAM superfamily enzyme YgiQ (UPF0313 family)
MSRILLGQSYFLRFDPKLWEAMQPYPPLGTLYAAAYLRQAGHQVALFDAMLASSEQEWADRLDAERPDIAVIYEDNFNYLSKMCLERMREAAFTMIAQAKTRGLPVLVAGSDATDHYRAYLDQGADYVILGEGEITLAEIVAYLDGSSELQLDQIPGLAWSEADIGSSGRRPDIRDLDSLPRPAWDLVDVERYREIWQEHHGYFSMNMVTTRGCPYHCNWCAKPIWGQRYNSRSPEAVAQEMGWLKATYKPDHIWFADDIMGLKPRWMDAFAVALEKENASIPFKCLSRADLLLRDGDIDAMARAGADIIWIGAESGAQSVLTAMEKGTKVEELYACRQKLAEAGVRVGFFLQFGYPGETRADVDATLQMIRDLMPDDIGMSVSYPLPGTKFHERVSGQLGEKQNWWDSNDLAMMYRGPFTTDFYRQLHVTMHKEYRSRKTWRQLSNWLRRPKTFRAGDLRRIAAMVFHTLTLPLARRRLNRLQHETENPAHLTGPGMSIEESAVPTHQEL